VDDGLGALLGSEVVVLVGRLGGHLAHDAADLVEEIAEELDGGVADAPVGVEEALLELGQEQGNSRVGVGVDYALAGLDGSVAHELAVVGEGLEDGLDDLADVGGEFLAEGERQVDEHHDVAVADVG